MRYSVFKNYTALKRYECNVSLPFLSSYLLSFPSLQRQVTIVISFLCPCRVSLCKYKNYIFNSILFAEIIALVHKLPFILLFYFRVYSRDLIS